MEFTFSSLFVFLVFIFLLHKLSKRNSRMKLPPGPKKLPIIGNLHQLPAGDLMHHGLRDLANKHGPLMHLTLGEIPTIVVSSPEMAKEIYRTHDILFSQRPTNNIAFKTLSYDFCGIVFSPYGNYWKTLRKICALELVNPKRVQSFQSIREEEVLKLIKSVSSASHKDNKTAVNLSQKIFPLTYAITSRAAFGKRDKSAEKFEKLTAEVSTLAAIVNISDLYPSMKFLEMFSGVKRKMEIAHGQLDEILQGIINQHKEKMEKSSSLDNKVVREGVEKDDIVDVLVRIQKNGDSEVPLADTDLKATLFDIFAAGGESSATTIEWAISEILRNPRILKRAQEEVRSRYDDRGNVDESNLDDLKYLEAIVKETLRFHPSLPLLAPRENKEHCKINGYDIPANTSVIVNAYAIGRDPNFWTDEPEVFKPERFLDSEIDFKGNHFQYIPFGAGRRICPGINFAQPNILLPLAQLLFHFDWKLSGGGKLEELDMEETMSVIVRRKNDLKLIPVPYSRSSLVVT